MIGDIVKVTITGPVCSGKSTIKQFIMYGLAKQRNKPGYRKINIIIEELQNDNNKLRTNAKKCKLKHYI